MNDNIFEVERFDEIESVENWKELWKELEEHRESLIYHLLDYIATTQKCLTTQEVVEINFEYFSKHFEGDKLEQVRILCAGFTAETIKYMFREDILRNFSNKGLLFPGDKGDRMQEVGKEKFPELEKLRIVSEIFKSVEDFTVNLRKTIWILIIGLIVLIPLLYGLRLII